MVSPVLHFLPEHTESMSIFSVGHFLKKVYDIELTKVIAWLF